MLPDGVRLDVHPSGLERLLIDTPACAAELFLHGATLTAWTPAGHRPVLYTSPTSHYRRDKPIRGGVPLCFPWFGPRAGAAQHGFARTSPWRLESAVATPPGIELTLALDARDPAVFPHAFTAHYRVTVGAKLECALTVTNTGEDALTYEDALHTYFAIDDLHAARIRGLEGAPYLDRSSAGGPSGTPRTTEPEAFGFTAETDRLYLGTTAPIEIVDGDRTITVAKDGARSTVVWNPWADKARALADLAEGQWNRFVCVEPVNAQADAVPLGPGAAHTTRMQVVVNAAR